MTRARLIIGIGLVILAIAFTMLDRQWGQTLLQPVGPVDHPLAVLVGLLGFAVLIFGAHLLRQKTR